MPAAAAKSKSRNSSGNSRQPPGPPLRDRVAAQLQSLAADAQCAELAEGAGDPEIAGDTVYRLMAHQLAAGHALTMSLGAHAGRLMREARAGVAGEPDGSRRSQEMLRFVAGTARLMERCRSAALALDRIGFPEVPEVDPEDDGPHNCKHRHHRAWVLQTERAIERKCVLDWLAQGKKAADLPDVEGWPPYHNPDPDIEKVDERLKPDSAGSHGALRRGRLKNNNPVGDYLAAPRCGAITRARTSCRQPAMANGRCRFHGGKSTGPRTAEGLRRSKAARLVHGFRTAEIIDLRSAAARMGRNLRALTRVARTCKESLTTEAQRHRENEDSALILQAEAPPALPARPLAAPSKQTGSSTATIPRSHGASVSLCRCGELSFPAGHGVHRSDFTRTPSAAGQKRRRRA
jgi:hypothetical protein